jgi:predicted XRE-type DNA-binding protein
MGIPNKDFQPVEISSKDKMRVIKGSEKNILRELVSQLPDIRSASKRMEDARSQPDIDQLFSMVWQSNELHLLFADTGVGKSIFAVAISVALCNGEEFLGLTNQTENQIVLFYDFELSDRQFRKRYSNDFGLEDPLHPNLFIDTLDFASISEMSSGNDDKFNDVVFDKISFDIESKKANIVILDNITFLSSQTTQDTQAAMKVMRRLNEMKKKYNISILVLAHTPKRNPFSPFTINDLAGSKHLSNFSDSISAIGISSYDRNVRYIKQIKPSRSGELLYDKDNVIVCEVVKPDTFLTFEFVEFGNEMDYLGEERRESKIDSDLYKITDMIAQGHNYRHIAEELGISISRISKLKAKNIETFENAIKFYESTLVSSS